MLTWLLFEVVIPWLFMLCCYYTVTTITLNLNCLKVKWKTSEPLASAKTARAAVTAQIGTLLQQPKLSFQIVTIGTPFSSSTSFYSAETPKKLTD